MQQGVQIAAGVPLQVGEGEEYMSFRIGLFGLDKLMNIDRTVSLFENALAQVETAQQDRLVKSQYHQKTVILLPLLPGFW